MFLELEIETLTATFLLLDLSTVDFSSIADYAAVHILRKVRLSCELDITSNLPSKKNPLSLSD